MPGTKLVLFQFLCPAFSQVHKCGLFYLVQFEFAQCDPCTVCTIWYTDCTVFFQTCIGLNQSTCHGGKKLFVCTRNQLNVLQCMQRHLRF